MDDGLPQRLVQARSALGWSQMHLATESGVAAAQISRYEAGRSRPRPEVLARIAKALKVPLEALMYGDMAPTQAAHKPHEVGRNSPRASRPMKGFVDPINIDAQQLLVLATQLASFHLERSTWSVVVGKLEHLPVDASAFNGFQRQLAAVEADILDTQEEIRLLVKE